MQTDYMTEIEGYTDLEEIGRGGFAVVYRARQLSVGRDVAIKLLTDPSPDDDLVRRFQRESKAVGALSWHPHIAAVVDAGSTTDGQAYIVFELLAGGSLDDRLATAPLAWEEAVASMIQVSDAVEAAHRADVLHRDIKPANILLDRLGVAKLGDFGIASMQDGTKTETGMLATTVAHAAPELFDGRPSSAATDIYALGSTLHTLVMGAPPFAPAPGERIATTIAQIVHTPPPRPATDIVPIEISNVTAHALAKQPGYRPRSAAAFGKALQQAQRDLGVRVTAMPVADQDAPVTPTPARPSSPAPPSPAALNPALPNPALPNPAPLNPASPSPDPPSLEATHGTDTAATRHVPFVPASPDAAGNSETKSFGRLIPALSAVAVLLAVGLGVLVWLDSSVLVTTTGGARIERYAALPETEMLPPFDGSKAIDLDATTAWGITPAANGTGIRGSSYVIELAEEQTIVRVGIINPNQTGLGRVTGIVWGTGFDDRGGQAGPLTTQDLPNEAGDFMTPYQVTTDTISLSLTGVYDDAENAGIAEILIEVEQKSDQS